MELLLLGAGALVLIAITLWIVWPERTTESPASASASAGGPTGPARASAASAIPPTAPVAATAASLSSSAVQPSPYAPAAAAGVALIAESNTTASEGTSSLMVGEASHWPEADATGEPIGRAERADTFLVPIPAAPHRSRLPSQPMAALGAAAALTLASAACGAALYARWQRQQNTPRQRLRRAASKLANRL